MRSLAFFICAFICVSTHGAFPPTPNVVDLYVNVALATADEDLEAKTGSWKCDSLGSTFTAFGKDMKEASTRLQLSCIKKRCVGLVGEVASAVNDLLGLSDEEYADLLEFSGRDAEEREKAMEARKGKVPRNNVVLTCENSASFRMAAFDLCFTTPMSCSH